MSAPRQPEPAGPVPPRDFDAEQATLGSMLLSEGAAARAFAIVGPADFYWEDHRLICQAMVTCGQRNEPVDLVTVSSELRRNSQLERVGGGPYLMALISSVPTAAHVARYANIVAEKSVLRGNIRDLGELTALAYSNPEDPLVVANGMMEKAKGTLDRVLPEGGLRTWAEAKPDILALVEKAGSGYRELSAQRLGIGGLDRIIGPLDKHRLVLVKGFSGDGKTHVMVNAAMSTAMELYQRGDERRVCIFSTESPGMYYRRGLAWATGIDCAWITDGFDGERYPEQLEQLRIMGRTIAEEFPLSIEEGEVTEDRLEADLRRHASQHGIAMVIIDYWQEIGLREGRTRREEFVTLAGRVKHLCVDEYRVPFLIGSQMSFDKDTGKYAPMESRQIQQAATLDVRLGRYKKNPAQQYVACDKDRESRNFGELPLHIDGRYSHIALIDDHRETKE